VKNIEQADARDEAHRQSKEQNEAGKAPSFDTDDFFSDALKRSYEAIGKKN